MYTETGVLRVCGGSGPRPAWNRGVAFPSNHEGALIDRVQEARAGGQIRLMDRSIRLLPISLFA